MYLLASSLPAALLDGHFEHPGVLTSSEPFDKVSAVIHAYTEFFCSLLDDWGHREAKSSPAWKFRMSPVYLPVVEAPSVLHIVYRHVSAPARHSRRD